jgi:[ribosomal protein S5]-alanine N-acetyltransferase
MPDGRALPARLVDCLPCVCGPVALRRLRVEDLEDFHAYRSDPEVGRYQGWAVVDREAAAAFLLEMSSVEDLRRDDWIQLGIADPVTDRLLGDVGMHLDAQGTAAEIGFTLAVAAQGRGLGLAAAHAAIELIWAASDAQIVHGITDARNTASIRTLERLGMDREAAVAGVFRGEPCTEYVYRLRRTQFRDQRP